MACFMEDALWGESTKFESIINKLKQVFCIGTEHKQIFKYMSIKLEQKSDFSITITQKNYINSISPVTLTQDDFKNLKRTLSHAETTKLRGILREINWIGGMTRPKISFFVCKTSKQIKDVIQYSKESLVSSIDISSNFSFLLLSILNSLIFTEAA